LQCQVFSDAIPRALANALQIAIKPRQLIPISLACSMPGVRGVSAERFRSLRHTAGLENGHER
jgi:hypothetical protein